MSANLFHRRSRLQQLLLPAVGCLSACAPVRDELFFLDAASAGRASSAVPSRNPTAGASSGSAGTAAGAAASLPPTIVATAGDLGLNPAITFSWTETIPGAGSCQAGKFTGNFSCDVDSVLLPERFEGSITLVLKGSTEAQLLFVDAGQLLVFDEDMRPVLTAPVTGALNCATQALSASVQPTKSEVMPAERQVAWLNAAQQPVTTGTLKGSLDPRIQTVDGDLRLLFNPAPTCAGKFSVRASP